MALSDVFLTPLGLAALGFAIPVVVLYLIRPDPDRVKLPTFRFLREQQRQRSTTPLLERVSRSLLLIIQLLALVLLATSLATPYVPVDERRVVEETVLVVDTSASMTAGDGEATRFERAVAAASEEVTDTTSIVTTGGGGRVLLRRGARTAAENELAELSVTEAPGDLQSAVAQARALADEDVRIVVLSDFAGDAWTDTVATARGQDLSVTLRQFDGGGRENVGFVDRRFSGTNVTLSVKNYADEQVTRTVALGQSRATVELGPDDVASVRLPVPPGGGQATLSPGDDFPTDDTVPVAAPDDLTIDVLVLTNDENRFLTTALSVVDRIDVTVDNPPTTVEDGYDVIVYSNIEPGSLLPGNLEAGRDVVADGGGVAVQAQPDMPDYGDLSLVDPTGTATAATIRRTEETDLTREINFQAPTEYVTGPLRRGTPLVQLGDGSPLIATTNRSDGRLLYYGYIEEQSSFKFNYQYPVFWKRAVFHLADREPLAGLNHETGETVTFDSERIEGPDGPLRGPTLTLRQAGVYRTEKRIESAALLDESESAVDVASLDDRPDTVRNFSQTEQRTVPRRLTEFGVIAVLLVLVLEVAYLRRRGDL
ncbi:hypothetical protein BRC64_08580 [Halobacteriales archaeon QH_10_67_22]|nr:MAG: hypothetical protein BRC64_08580 [Halobacteriales archaeon QH_10_67_22]